MYVEIRNGRVIDPKNGVDRVTSLFVAGDKVASIGEAPVGCVDPRVIDATGCVVCPGLIDLSARLNSIEAELAAAVAGGVTSVVVPPDADPPLDESRNWPTVWCIAARKSARPASCPWAR